MLEWDSGGYIFQMASVTKDLTATLQALLVPGSHIGLNTFLFVCTYPATNQDDTCTPYESVPL